MKARKLIARSHLEMLYDLHQMGVPVSRIKRDNDINLSMPTFSALLDDLHNIHLAKSADSVYEVIEASLFPPWLTPDIPAVQEQPDTWHYIGKFPLGAWAKR